MRKPIIAGNWKMNMDIHQSMIISNAFKRAFYEIEDVEIVICPPFTSLSVVQDIVLNSNIVLGAQDLHWEDDGPYTGEISASMLKSVGCQYVIIGHSERRKYFCETNESVNKKVKQALENGLRPIMCVGETLEEREKGKTFDVVREHLEKGLHDIDEKNINNVVIAYEPVWAIGTGKNATPQQAEEVHNFIRNFLMKKYDPSVAENIRIQYGGSVKPENIESLIREKNVDGALVGGASLKEESFVEIVKRSSSLIKNKPNV